MSFGDELNTRRRDEVTRLQYQNIGTDQQINDNADPGFFAGTGGGFMSELASAGRSVAIAGGAIPAAIDWAVGDDNRGEPLADRYFRQVDEYTKGAVDYWKPAPAATGTGGAVLGPLAGGLVELAAGGGNPALMLARQDIGTAGELVDQGVDATTAQMVGGAQSLATAVGFGLGTYGNSLMKKMASGAAGNLATNVPAAAASQAALEHGGYAEQAKQFNPWDMHARAVDVLMGAVFGAAAHFGERPAVGRETPRQDVPPSAQHAVLAEAGVKNWSVDTAPGNPADAVSMAAHDSAMGTALDQMMRGEQVNIGDKLQGATFEPRDKIITGIIEEIKKLIAQTSESNAIVYEASKLFGKQQFKENIGFATNEDINVTRDALLPIAGEKLTRGEVKQLNAELADLQKKRQEVADTPAVSYKDTAKEALKGQRNKKVKDALKLAEEIRAQDIAPIDERINAIQDRLSRHDTASQAESMLSRIEQYKLSPAYANAQRADLTSAPEPNASPVQNDATKLPEQTTTATQKPDGTITNEGTKTAELPEVVAARSAIARQPKGTMINIGDDDNPNMVPAHEAWAQLDNEVQQAQKDAGMFDAAVTCFLGG